MLAPSSLSDRDRRALGQLRISDSVASALATARTSAAHHFSVSHRGRVLGMVCACDLEQASPERLVGEVMHPAVMLPQSRSAAEAAMLMQAAHVGAVLLTDASGAPCGFVTRTDLSAEPNVQARFDDYRCPACGTIHHLPQRGDKRPCASCHQHAGLARPRGTGGTLELSIRGE